MSTRKEFLRILTFLGITSVLPVSFGKASAHQAPRKGKGNRFVENGRPLLVVVEGRDADRMLARGLEALGGLDKLVDTTEEAYIKPNYGSHRAYPTGSDPHFLVSIAGRLKEQGCAGVTICDSSDAYVLNRYNDHEYVFKVNNVFEIGQAAGVSVICTHPTDENEYVPVRSEKWELHPEIEVNRRLLSAPVIINQPMLKRHGEAHMTCALKNAFGVVYQPKRANAHKQLREGGDAGRRFFMKTIPEFADAIKPELTIVDARKILTVRGPSFKEGSLIRDVNRLILSGDMVAADAYCASLLDEHDETFHKESIETTLEYAQALGLGTMDLNQVRIVELSA